MIPSDRETKLALRRDFIRITPPPPDTAFSSTAIDLTLHEQISVWLADQQQATTPVVVYPGRPTFDPVALLSEHASALILPAEGFIARPA
jgi:hypothetical protein